jgi:hypothetical protein
MMSKKIRSNDTYAAAAGSLAFTLLQTASVIGHSSGHTS